MRRKNHTLRHSIVEGFSIAVKALIANKTRTALTTLGIVIGVVTITLMMMIIQGLNQSFTNQISFLGSNTVYVDQYPWVWDDDWWKYINRPKISVKQYDNLKTKLKSAEAIAPTMWTGRPITFRDKAIERVGVLGTTADYIEAHSAIPEFGRFISESDNRASRRVCVIGSKIRQDVFGIVDPLGQKLRIGAHNYVVIGILEEQGSFFGSSRDNFVALPMNTFMNTFGRHRSVDILVKAKEDVLVEDMTDQIRGIMRLARNQKPLDEDNFSINQQDALQNVYKSITKGVYGAGLIIGGIALLVGGIGIMNIMLVSVTERTWEIGMRKAVGARTSHIMWQFLIESMIICVIGGTIGMLIALGVGEAIKAQLPAVLPPWIAAMAILFSAGIGLVFGLFPAAKAAKMDPIMALRAE